MKAAFFHEKGYLSVTELERPKVGISAVLVKVKACGICGTDLHILKGEFPVSPPLILGHEFLGEVAEKRSEVTSVDIGGG